MSGRAARRAFCSGGARRSTGGELVIGLPQIPEFALWAIYFAPLVSFVVISVVLLLRLPVPDRRASDITILAVGLSWLLGLWALDTSIELEGQALGLEPHLWMELFNLRVSFGIALDSLSALMIFVVTSISLVVQVYSTGYMAGDRGYARYFMFMSLFTVAMLGLVMGSSLLQLFIHWELVGLTSYLLVGFWFHRPSAAAAAKKAFIVTRFGDFFFMIAVVLIWDEERWDLRHRRAECRWPSTAISRPPS